MNGRKTRADIPMLRFPCLFAERNGQEQAGGSTQAPLHAVDTRASRKRLMESLFGGEVRGVGPRHVIGGASPDPVDVLRVAEPGDCTDAAASHAPDRGKKRKRGKKVASHTGKFCDNDTMKSLVAAAAEAAERGVGTADDSAAASDMSGKARKINQKIQGKGGRRSISRLTVEKRKRLYDSGSDAEVGKAVGDSLVGVTHAHSLRSSDESKVHTQYSSSKFGRKHSGKAKR